MHVCLGRARGGDRCEKVHFQRAWETSELAERKQVRLERELESSYLVYLVPGMEQAETGT